MSDSNIVSTLVEMGFPKERAELAVLKTGTDSVQVAIDWLLSNEDTTVGVVENEESTSNQENVQNEQENQEEKVAKSIRCDDCGKLFRSQDEVEFHASKSGHENFSESTEEKKALTVEEKKEQLAKIEAKLRQRRLDREAREKQEALEKEKCRIKSGKEMLQAKQKHEELEMKKMIEQRKREKEEERLARQRVKDQIEQDRQARKAQQSGVEPPAPPQAAPEPTQSKPSIKYDQIQLQIRLTNGQPLMHTFSAKEPLSAVRLFIEMNRKDDDGPFVLMTSFPKKVFKADDYNAPLETLGLGPRATLIVSKTA